MSLPCILILFGLVYPVIKIIERLKVGRAALFQGRRLTLEVITKCDDVPVVLLARVECHLRQLQSFAFSCRFPQSGNQLPRGHSQAEFALQRAEERGVGSRCPLLHPQGDRETGSNEHDRSYTERHDDQSMTPLTVKSRAKKVTKKLDYRGDNDASQ